MDQEPPPPPGENAAQAAPEEFLDLDDLLAEDAEALDLEWEAQQRAAEMARGEDASAEDRDPDDLDFDAEWAAHQRAAERAQDDLDPNDGKEEESNLSDDPALFGRRASDDLENFDDQVRDLTGFLADEIGRHRRMRIRWPWTSLIAISIRKG